MNKSLEKRVERLENKWNRIRTILKGVAYLLFITAWIWGWWLAFNIYYTSVFEAYFHGIASIGVLLYCLYLFGVLS